MNRSCEPVPPTDTPAAVAQTAIRKFRQLGGKKNKTTKTRIRLRIDSQNRPSEISSLCSVPSMAAMVVEEELAQAFSLGG